MNKRYLITDASLFYDDEIYSNTNTAGDQPVVLFKNVEEANVEKNRLELNKLRNLFLKEPLEVLAMYWSNGRFYVERGKENEFWEEVKTELQTDEINFAKDEHLVGVINFINKKFKAKCVDFYFITELELEE